ncbi:MAG: DUF4139 domain-containing protein [Myxococcales bacterium]|nr:DUF4139 domain-containing protein [Myxococcales bacterium]
MAAPLLTSRIDLVTVYRAGALVERVAQLPAALPGDGVVRVGGLPLSLDDSSVRARVDGARELVVRDLRVTLTHDRSETPLLPVEPAALRAARRRLAQLEDRRAHLEAQRARLSDVTGGPRGQGERGRPPPPIPFEARLAWLDFRDGALEELDRELARAHEATRLARQELATLEARDREATSERAPQAHELRKAAQLTLAGAITADARLVVEYRVPGARWSPSYTITLDRGQTRGRLAVRAVVAQRTGEDWRGVALELSTADCQRWTELPELKSIRVGRRQPSESARGWRQPPAGAAELFADYNRFTRDHAPVKPVSEAKPAKPAVPSGPPPPPPPLAGAPMPAQQSMTLAGGLPPGVTLQDAIRQAEAEARLRSEAEARARDMAMPAAMLAPESKKSSGFGGLFGGGGGGVSRAAPPPPAAKARRVATGAARPPSAPRPSAPGQPLARSTPPPPSSDPGDDWLSYGDLRMPTPSESTRGALVRLERHERYRELVWVRERSYERHVVALIDAAETQAAGVERSPLPARHKPLAPQELGGFDYIYRAEGRVEILSDGAYHGVPLLTEDIAAKPFHVVVPRVSNDVFRRVTLRNPLEVPLLAGPADIYQDGDFLLSTDLRTCAPRGELEFGLGVVQAIKVARNTRFAEETAGLMGGALLLRHAIEIELANRTGSEVAIEVRERVPVTREGDDEVVVEVAEATPPWRSYEPEEHKLRGGHRWSVRVPAGDTLTLKARYVVRISSRRELVGGNRRER